MSASNCCLGPRRRPGRRRGPALGAVAAALRRAVLSEDADALTLVPGIGKKTAARLVMELAPRFEGAAEISAGEVPGQRPRLLDEPRAALTRPVRRTGRPNARN